MVYYLSATSQTSGIDAAFSALGDPTRRAILLALVSEDELPLSQLAVPFEMSLPAVSKHVRVLSAAGLVTVEKRGRVRYCRLNRQPLEAAADWLTPVLDRPTTPPAPAYLREYAGPGGEIRTLH
ncbi:MAG TPA: hypothetical protein DCS82_01005 [Rhodospirillaceae bacterium]|nr:hypothetical protein [Rhodospirillaceae bacterium]HAT34267.1 hypothetical protein [Rhodospirillaceae bacterium]